MVTIATSKEQSYTGACRGVPADNPLKQPGRVAQATFVQREAC
jgi:hypothetical protein